MPAATPRKLLTLVRHALVYGLGAVGQRLIAFVLIPVYTRFLTPADYGLLGLATTTAGLLKILSMAGVPGGMLRSHFMASGEPADRQRALGTGLLTLVAYGSVILAALLVFRDPLSGWIFGSPVHAPLLVLVALSNFAYIFQAGRDTYFRIHNRSGAYSLVNTGATLLNLTLALTLVAGLGLKAEGALGANTTTAVVMALIFLPWALRQMMGGYSLPVAREILSYGVPLIPMNLAVWTMNLSDILMIRAFRTPDEVGLYNLGYRFGMAMYLITNALKTALPTLIFVEGTRRESDALFSRLPTYYLIIVASLATAGSVLAPEIIRIADRAFWPAWPVIPFALFGYVLFGLAPLVQVGLDVVKKIKRVAAIYVAGALLNIILNLALIPRYGFMAAAVTTVATYGLLTVAVYLAARRHHPMRLEWGRLAHLAALLGAAALAGLAVSPESLALRVLWKSAALTLIPALIWGTGLLSADEKARIRALLKATADHQPDSHLRPGPPP